MISAKLAPLRRASRKGIVRVTGLLAKIESWITRYPGGAFLCVSALYIVVVSVLSSIKLLWLDELITLHIARLGSVAAIWHALSQGADPNPPLTHVLVLFSRSIFGEREFALRLPAMVVYWVGLLCLYLYLRRRLKAAWALSGVVLSMTMASFDYSFESRSYAIFYGFAMLAVYCWSVAVDPGRSTRTHRWGLIGMTCALAAGISTNYFAVLAFIPIAAGEFARFVQTIFDKDLDITFQGGRPGSRALDLRVAAGLTVAALPLLLYRPLVERSIAQFSPYAWNRVSMGQVSDSYTQMVEITLYPIVALFIFGLLYRLISWSLSALSPSSRAEVRPRWIGRLLSATPSRLSFPLYELVAIVFLMAYPLLGFVVASIRGGMLSPRFVIPVCLGFAIAGTIVAHDMLQNVPRAGTTFLCLWILWFVARESVVGYWYEEQRQCFYKVLDHLPDADRSVPAGSPIVVPDPLMALTLQHYAPADVASRIIFPIDFSAIRRYRRNDSPEQNLWAGRGAIYSMAIMPMSEFQAHAGPYLILASDGNWLLDDLDAHHYAVERLGINTRAGALEYFTPLFHGVPVFYVGAGDRGADQASSREPRPVPFQMSDDLPASALLTSSVMRGGR